MQQKKQSKNPANPYCSDSLQVLLDIKKAMERPNVPELTDIDDIIAEMQKKTSLLRTTADTVYHSHKYPDKAIKYFQSATYDTCPERFELSKPELVLLDFMERIQDPQTGYVSVTKGYFVDAIKSFTQTDRKALQDYLDHLTELGFLTCIHRQVKREPGEYKVNQSISWVGKNNGNAIKLNFKDFKRKFMRIVKEIVLPDGTKARSGALDVYKEEEVSPTKTNLIKESMREDSTHQDDSNPKPKNRQEDLPDLPDISELFTSDEQEAPWFMQ